VKPSLLLLACLVSLPAFAQSGPKDTDPSTEQISAVIDDFRTSIINKDKKRFLSLFLHESITWQSASSDELLKRALQKNPKAVKLVINDKRNPATFIDGIVADKERNEEKFSNIKINTDGTVASVYFDFTFHEGEQIVNRGQESWHLVNTGNGWKIASVVWSNN
jgi:hypothetical protein